MFSFIICTRFLHTFIKKKEFRWKFLFDSNQTNSNGHQNDSDLDSDDK